MLARMAHAAAARLPLISRIASRADAIRVAMREPIPASAGAPHEALLISGSMVQIEGVDIIEALDRPFTARDRDPARVIMAMIHESVTTSTAATEATLRRRKVNGVADQLGVHLALDPAGPVHQHNDLGTDRLIHAAGHNGQSVGIEIVTPYYPRHLRAGMPWTRVIEGARWAHEGRYVVPTRAQLEALVDVLRCLFDATAQGLIGIIEDWPGQRGDFLAMSRIAGLREAPGIQAHCYSDHADGAFPVLYAYLRIQRSLSAADAYSTAIRLASKPRWREGLGWCADLREVGR